MKKATFFIMSILLAAVIFGGCKKDKKEYVIIGNFMVQTEDLGRADYCPDADAMCAKSSVGGFTDWRLPTIDEISMVFAKKDEIGGFSNNYYWTTNYNDYCETFIVYDFTYGQTEYCSDIDDVKLFSVRAVRTITQ